jgi:hypothetical protein
MLIMNLHANQRIQLIDKHGRVLGHVKLEGSGGDLITGTFEPGPEYASVGDLFGRFEEAADSQALAAVEEMDKAIATLGLSLSLPDGSQRQIVHDVQIWSDGGFSCRPSVAGESSVNGTVNLPKDVPATQERIMTFVTYENRRNPHVTIHAANCSQIRKRGGEHKYDQGEYRDHQTLDAAEHHAQDTGLPLIYCSFCRPHVAERE